MHRTQTSTLTPPDYIVYRDGRTGFRVQAIFSTLGEALDEATRLGDAVGEGGAFGIIIAEHGRYRVGNVF